MRVGLLSSLILVVAILSPRPALAQGDPAAVIAAAREALGGDRQLSAVKSFLVIGRTRQVRGNNLVPIEFEIACELPGKYVRRDEVPAQETGITARGFNGDALIQHPPPEPGRAGRPAKDEAPPPATVAPSTPPASGPSVPAGRAARATSGAAATPVDPVTTLKQYFVRLTLGMFATSFAAYPLTFTLAGQAEAPQGRADIVDVKGPGTFALRFFINSETHLPIMVSWTQPATGAANAGRGQNMASAGATPVEYRLYYADYRDIGNGLKFPFRLRRAVAGETVEETNIDEFRINPKIDQKKFVTVK